MLKTQICITRPQCVNFRKCKQLIKWGTNKLIRFRARPACTYLGVKKVRVNVHSRLNRNVWRQNTINWLILIRVYIQQDATLHSLSLSGNCSTCFGWYHHPSSGAQTTVSTASSICHTVTSICRYRGRVGTSLSVLWVAYADSSFDSKESIIRLFVEPYCRYIK